MVKRGSFDSVDVTYTCLLTGVKEKDLDKFEELREKHSFSKKLKEKKEKK